LTNLSTFFITQNTKPHKYNNQPQKIKNRKIKATQFKNFHNNHNTHKAFVEMGLNHRVGNLIEVILDPTDGGDPTGLTTTGVLAGQRVARKGRQR